MAVGAAAAVDAASGAGPRWRPGPAPSVASRSAAGRGRDAHTGFPGTCLAAWWFANPFRLHGLLGKSDKLERRCGTTACPRRCGPLRVSAGEADLGPWGPARTAARSALVAVHCSSSPPRPSWWAPCLTASRGCCSGGRAGGPAAPRGQAGVLGWRWPAGARLLRLLWSSVLRPPPPARLRPPRSLLEPVLTCASAGACGPRSR